MQLDEALRHALDGDSILFLGAGFSRSALNARGERLPLASELARTLAEAAGEHERVELDIASRLYRQVNGATGLLSFLKDSLSVGTAQDHHRTLAKIRWRRVYTTNYDDLFEIAARYEGCAVRTLTLTPEIPVNDPAVVDCIHINGFLAWANVQNIDDSLILSDTSYLTNRFVQSRWASLLRSDFEAARSILFVGYSLADLDIDRVLFNVERLKRKTVFVVQHDPGLALRSTLDVFGQMAAVGVEGAAALVVDLETTYTPARRQQVFQSFRQFDRVSISQRQASGSEVFDLFCKGVTDPELLAGSISTSSMAYALRRNDVDRIIDAFVQGAPTVLVLSRLGNGKSMLSDMIKIRALDRFDVFSLVKDMPSTDEEVSLLRDRSRPTIIFFDDYARHLETIAKLSLGRGSSMRLLLTCRTPSHLIRQERLSDALGHAPMIFEVDALTPGELGELDKILSAAGLLGEAARLSPAHRVEEIFRKKGSGELGHILLWLFETPDIRKRLLEVFESIKHQERLSEIIAIAMILTHIGVPPDLDDLAEFIDVRSINQGLFAPTADVSNFVHLRSRVLFPRSDLFATAMLRMFWAEGTVEGILGQMLAKAFELRSSDRRFHEVVRDLMRYSKIKHMTPQTNRHELIRSYYDSIRTHGACANNDLFWLQVALSDLDAKRFDLAERHIGTSYGLAARMRGYETYQIDNVKASFLLQREIEEMNASRAFSAFVDANAIISRQLREQRDGYYPFRVAALYESFWKRVAQSWSGGQRDVFQNAARSILRQSQAAPAGLSKMDDVRRCTEVIGRLVGSF